MGTTCHKSWINFNKITTHYKIINDYVHFNKFLTVEEFNYITNTR